MSMLRSSAIQRRDYAVKDLAAYDLPNLPEQYYWKLWIPTFYQPLIAFLELRRRFGLVYEVVDNTTIMVDEPQALRNTIQKQALLLAVLRAYNIQLHYGTPSGAFSLESTYELWTALQDKLPKLPATYLWEIKETSDDSIAVVLRKRILRSEDTRVISERTCPLQQDIAEDSSAISHAAQGMYIERFLT